MEAVIKAGEVVEIVGTSRFTWEKAGDGIRLIPIQQAPKYRVVGKSQSPLLRHRRIEPGAS